MNLAEMFSTTGSALFYGGIIGAAVSIVIGVISILWFAGAGKRLEKKINSEYSDIPENFK